MKEVSSTKGMRRSYAPSLNAYFKESSISS